MKTPRPLRAFRLLACLSVISAASLAGAAVVTWSGAGPDQNWSDAANWSGGTPSGNIVVFPGAMFPASTNVLGATNSMVDSSITISQLWYNNTNALFGSTSNAYDTTLINPYVTLTVGSNLYVGANNNANATTVAAMVGTNCALIVSNLGATFGVGYTNNANSVQYATFTLADGTNFIDVGTFAVGNSVGGNGRQSILNLGNGTNIINAPLIELGLGKAQGTVQFGGASGGVAIAGTNGTRADLILGRASSGSGGANGQLVLTNYADVLASTVTNGWGAGDSSAGSGKGTITIQEGIFDVTTLALAANTSGTQPATGTFNLGGNPTATATLIVNSPSGPGGGLFLLSDANNGTQTGAGTFTINTNGAAEIYCSITKRQAANNTATLNLNGGTLVLESVTNVIGSAAIPIDTVNLNGGTLQLNVDGDNPTTASIIANSVTASTANGMNLINIGSVTNVTIPVTIQLITYLNAGDPGLANFQLGTVPAGYTATLQDNVNGDNSIDLSISANIPIVPLLWVGALNSSWDFSTKNWQNLTNGSASAYANPDLVYFDDTASSPTVTLKTNFGPGAFTFSNSVLNYTLTGPGSVGGGVGLVMDGSASVTLAETGGDSFAGGVAVNSGTVILDDANSAIGGVAAIGPGATLQIGNQDTNGILPSGGVSLNGTLIFDQTSGSTVASAISGSGSLTLNGTGAVTLSSAANDYTGNTTVNAGTLALTGSGTISNSQAVAVSGATLDVSGITGVTLLNSLSLANATVNVNATNTPYLQPPINLVSGSLNMSGTGNAINVTALPVIASYPTPLTLIQAAGGLSGFNLTLGTLPAGYSGYLTNNYDNGSGPNNAVLLVLTSGPAGARPYVTWSGVDAQGSVTTNWSDAMNWELPGAPLPTDTVIFDQAGQQSASAYSSPGGGASALNFANVNNIVDANFTVATLIYTNIGNAGSPSYQNTYLNDGKTLTITNSLAIGSSSVDFGDAATEVVTIAGTNGTVTLNNTNSTFVVGLASAAGSGEQATLDMSGLGTFNASVSFFQVGAIASTADEISGVAYLAQTNTISAVGGSGSVNEGGQDEALSFLVGETGKGASTEAYLYLGQQNVIHAYTIGIGIAKDLAEMQFNPIWSNPTVTILGGDGVSPVQVWSIGDALAQTGGSTSPAGTADFTGGTVNAVAATMYIGRSPNASGPHPATGTLTFGAGTIAVGTIYDGFQAFNTTDNGVGTVNVNGTGLLQVGTLNLAWTTGATGASPTTGALNITGGTVAAGTITGDTNNTGQSSITLNGGTLIVTNAIGSAAAPLTSLTLQGGALQLSPNASGTNIVATTVTSSGTTTINVASVVTSVGGAQEIPLISYTGADPTTAGLVLGTVPFGYSNASLVDDGVGHIYLQVTAPAALVWAGALAGGTLDGNWNTADQNWLNGATHVAYANPDFAQFDDTASASAVTVAAPVSPGSLNVTNNVLNYVFSGTHAISGTASLTKSGTGSLTLADTGGDNFSGGLTVNGGALLLDNVGSSLGGNVTIAGGSVQLGNNDANGNLPGNVADNGSLILNRSDNLTLANAFSGSGTVTQMGTNTITLSGANSLFTGKLMVTNGILNTTAATGLGGAAATTVITNAGTLDDNGIAFNAAAAPLVLVSGAGYNGAGAIINNGVAQESAFSNLTLMANVTLGGSNRWDLRASSGTAASLNLSPAGSPYSLTKIGANEIALVNVGTIDAGLGDIYVQAGEFAVQVGTAQLGNPASNLVVSAGATLELYGLTTPLNKVIEFNGDGTNDSFKSDNSTATQNVVNGPVTLNGNCVFDISSNVFATFGGVVGGTGDLTKITQGTLTLTNVDTYTGDTAINAGVLALSGSGSIASSNIAIAAGAGLNAAGRANQTLTLNAGQTLSGFGTVTGIVSAASGSTIAPGSASATGVLTFQNNVILAGTNTMKVTHAASATNDVLSVGGSLALGGTLNLTLLGNAFAAGDTFKLYTAGGGLEGTFSATNLPALPGGLGWVTTNLVNGIVSIVTAVNTSPTNLVATVVGNTLSLSWPADQTGWRLLVQTNSLGAGLNLSSNAWVAVPGSASVNTETFTLDPTVGTVFYRLTYP